MALRAIGYDGASYRSQLDHKESQRYPVSTLVLYYGDQNWKQRVLKEKLRAEGLELGKADGKIETSINMIALGLSDDVISRSTGLPVI